MHVEWYSGDFSDPEAVSGSSTKKSGPEGRFFIVELPAGMRWQAASGKAIFVFGFSDFRVQLWSAGKHVGAVENSKKNYKKSVQKCVDVSVLWV